MLNERTTALASRYVLGTASAEERREFEAALHADERLQLLVKELRGTQGGPVPQPAAMETRGRWENPTSSTTRPLKISDWLLWSPWVVSTCFAALCLLLISSIRAQRERAAELASKLEQQNREIVRLQRQNAQLQKAGAEQATNYQQRIRQFESNLMKGVEQLSARTAAVTNQLNQKLASATRELAAARKEIAETSNARIALEHAVALLAARDRERFETARLVALRPSATSDDPAGGVGALLWSPDDQRGILVVEKLRPLPAIETYQLWLMERNGTSPVSGGLVPSVGGSIHMAFSARSRLDSLKGAFLTIESATGATTPSRRMVLSGE